ncbi:MATE family efflux transporter [Halobellus salinus]|uniref:Multidrug-efflux transporter n=1 Tax=Halobellus salinus TaxID=931585 RepID=A0A830EQD5_9EURY|nr:MATE family efflux transporter [Halobellus salinus]GGJ13605.1 MATE family efflux transporter [Halobellus salinus]SMP31007.1 putative efflux protein, MATE family [Halobellus salinus]
MSRLRQTGSALARSLANAGVIDEPRLRATVDLAWPRVVTGFAIMSKRTVDLALVGIVLGPAAVAGLTLANAFWMVAKFLAIGLAGGTVSLVSQNYGGDDVGRAATVVRLSVLLAVAFGAPVAVFLSAAAGPLVGLLGENPASIRYGTAYLAVVAPGLLFEYLNLIASRTYAGVSDTVTPMAVRAGGALANIALSATFVLGLDMGVVGAALGTALATGLVTVVFAWGMTGRNYVRGWGASPVPLTRSGPWADADLLRQIARVSTPLVARRAAQGLAVFPLLAIAATFGPVAVAAIGVGRQVRSLLGSFSWGFSIAASTLVGQELGAGAEGEAEAYGWGIVRLSAVVYVIAAAVVAAFGDPIAGIFVNDPVNRGLSAQFVRVAAASVVALGVDGSITGALRGAGDTRVPFLATLAGLYLVALPVAWLGTVAPALGVGGLLFALLAEYAVPMVVNLRRFRSNRWKTISRGYRPTAGN